MQVYEFLEMSADKYPDKEAVWYKEKWMTYSEIETFSNKIANYLKDIGIKRGNRVALLYENSFDHIISYFGIIKAGAVCVALNTESTSIDIKYLLNDSGAKAIIINKQFLKNLAPVLNETPELNHIISGGNKPKDLQTDKSFTLLSDVYQMNYTDKANVRGIDIDLEAIVYTSGSTGKPKGVMLTHLNTVSNMRSIAEYLHLTKDDRVMVVLPFYYIYGKSLLLTHFLVGGSVVIDNRFAYPNVVLKTMKETEVTGFAGVPSTFMILLDKSMLSQYKFPKLRYVTQAGGAMAPNVQKRVYEAFKPADLYIMYGATEAAPRLSYVEPDVLPKKWGSIGKPVPNVDVFIADEKGNPLPPGEIGEIVARGSNIMVGYWHDPKGTKQVLKNGLYYTGDLGKMDEEGFLYVVGRKKDIIKVGGFRVSAKEIEEAILELDEIQETAVIGVDDPVLGEAIKAYIVLKKGANIDEQSISNHLKKILSTYKLPKFYEFRDNLPKNKSGKILKTKLKEENK